MISIFLKVSIWMSFAARFFNSLKEILPLFFQRNTFFKVLTCSASFLFFSAQKDRFKMIFDLLFCFIILFWKASALILSFCWLFNFFIIFLSNFKKETKPFFFLVRYFGFYFEFVLIFEFPLRFLRFFFGLFSLPFPIIEFDFQEVSRHFLIFSAQISMSPDHHYICYLFVKPIIIMIFQHSF